MNDIYVFHLAKAKDST